MVKNFHFKMLMGISISCFVIGFFYLLSGLQSNTDRVGAPMGGFFCMFGLFAAITADALRAIHRRLDGAGIMDDPQQPLAKVCSAKQKTEL